ncbi:ABC transporter ATP-binding protein [Desulfosporosinus sp. BICA1-9]|uniref:ABC transporter ATP-binding protein n=1 Tax=Desulfosporosinus sp. BICA1-9 TaxID=1531958 RepID=UPI00054B2FAC|nr:ABC transporter ATP-binding protein [Desulfosporosinus sp. BICA1-9]KJS85099.1 MAG: ABC transporter [Desulfosporosinus sp. BICA1-9]
MIRVEGLRKIYGKMEALKGISLEIEQGSIFGFVGPNGAGKTTTMKILATLMVPTEGKAYIDGVDVTKHPKKVRSLMGYMPDFFGVYERIKVTEYLDFYASCYGISRGKRRSIIADLLELTDLNFKADAYVDSLSRGMKQRLCLARSLVHDPKVLLLDEPASGLDPRARVEMRELLRELKNMGKSIIISSHILPELAELCTEVGIIEGGELVAVGSMDSITAQLQQERLIQVKVQDNISAARAMMEENPWVAAVNETADGVLQVRFSGNPEEQQKLLRALVLAELPVLSFAESSNSLEDLFMQITKGAAR